MESGFRRDLNIPDLITAFCVWERFNLNCLNKMNSCRCRGVTWLLFSWWLISLRCRWQISSPCFSEGLTDQRKWMTQPFMKTWTLWLNGGFQFADSKFRSCTHTRKIPLVDIIVMFMLLQPSSSSELLLYHFHSYLHHVEFCIIYYVWFKV